MDIIKELEDRKKKLTDLDKERTKVETLYEQVMSQLAAQGFDSIEAAEAEVDKRKKAKAESEAEAVKLITEFDEKYKDFL